jgi:hypothetical protein
VSSVCESQPGLLSIFLVSLLRKIEPTRSMLAAPFANMPHFESSSGSASDVSDLDSMPDLERINGFDDASEISDFPSPSISGDSTTVPYEDLTSTVAEYGMPYRSSPVSRVSELEHLARTLIPLSIQNELRTAATAEHTGDQRSANSVPIATRSRIWTSDIRVTDADLGKRTDVPADYWLQPGFTVPLNRQDRSHPITGDISDPHCVRVMSEDDFQIVSAEATNIESEQTARFASLSELLAKNHYTVMRGHGYSGHAVELNDLQILLDSGFNLMSEYAVFREYQQWVTDPDNGKTLASLRRYPILSGALRCLSLTLYDVPVIVSSRPDQDKVKRFLIAYRQYCEECGINPHGISFNII